MIFASPTQDGGEYFFPFHLYSRKVGHKFRFPTLEFPSRVSNCNPIATTTAVSLLIHITYDTRCQRAKWLTNCRDDDEKKRNEICAGNQRSLRKLMNLWAELVDILLSPYYRL